MEHEGTPGMEHEATLAASRKVRPAPWDDATLTTYRKSKPAPQHEAVPAPWDI